MSREAMQMALWTLEGWANHDNWVWPESALEQAKRNTIEAIAALRQALEEKQEPRPCKVGSACVPTENGSCACSQLTPSTNSVVTQTEQEPVAWRSTSPDGELSNEFACKPTESNWVEPLYTAPPNREITCVCGAVWEGETMVHPPREREWVGLTAYEIQEIYSGNQHWGNFACAIEAKLKEKNS